MYVGVDAALHKALGLPELCLIFKSKTMFLPGVALPSFQGYFHVPRGAHCY